MSVFRSLWWAALVASAGCGTAVPPLTPDERVDGSSSRGPRLAIESFTPRVTALGTTTDVTLEGAGFATSARVTWAGLLLDVIELSEKRLVVSVPAVDAPRRAPIEIEVGGEVARTSSGFAARLQAPDQWHYAEGPSLPVKSDVVAAIDLDADGKLEFVVNTAADKPQGGGGTRPTEAGLRVVHPGDDLAALPKPSTPEAKALVPVRGEAGPAVLATTKDGLELLTWKNGALVRAAVPRGAGITVISSGPRGVLVARNEASGTTIERLSVAAGVPSLEPVVTLGTFEVVSIESGDVDRDGAEDLLIGGKSAGPRLLRSGESGAFREAPYETFPRSLAGTARWADIDADGALDVVIASQAGDAVWRNVDGRFVDRTRDLLARTDARAAFEADLDGDAAVERVGGAGLSLLRNDGEGRFFDFTLLAARPWRLATPLAALDADGDADVDLFVREADGTLRILRHLAGEPFTDADHDGWPDDRDVCPRIFDPEQANRDQHPFSCVTADCGDVSRCSLQPMGTKTVLACKNTATFANARKFCAERGAGLALPATSAESKALVKATGEGWIDLSDEAREGRFVTSSGANAPYAGWRAGQPDNAGGAEDCAMVWSDGTWNDTKCNDNRPFACVEVAEREGDTFGDACDVCPGVPDPVQADADADGIGDACEAAP